MAQKYKNLPLKPDVYETVKLIAEANGFGERGLGKQVEEWAKRELPACDHPKEPVTVEIFPSQGLLSGSVLRAGWYCPTCKRVYQRSEVAVSGVAADPYGQPIPPVVLKKRGSSPSLKAVQA